MVVARPAGAGSTAPTSRTLAGGSAGVAACGSLGSVVPDFVISSGAVTSVVLTGIPSTCNGGNLRATVTSGATSLGSGGPVTVSSGAATVPISPAVATASVTHVRLAVVGP